MQRTRRMVNSLADVEIWRNMRYSVYPTAWNEVRIRHLKLESVTYFNHFDILMVLSRTGDQRELNIRESFLIHNSLVVDCSVGYTSDIFEGMYRLIMIASIADQPV